MMKKKTIIIMFILPYIVINSFGQSIVTSDDEAIVRRVADNILDKAVFQYEGVYNGSLYTTAKEIPDTLSVKFKSPRAEWNVGNGMLNLALFDLSKFLNDEKYSKNVLDYLSFQFDNMPVFIKRYNPKSANSEHNLYKSLIDPKELEAYGLISANVIEAYQRVDRKDFKEFVESSAKYITETQDRLTDKTIMRKQPVQYTLVANDLYMSIPFLVRMGKFMGDRKYYDDAIRQVFNYNQYLWDPFRELNYQCWYSANKQNGVAHLATGDGFIMMAQAQLLNILPGDYPRRDSLVKNLEQQILGISRYQNKDGLWYVLPDKPDSYVESSSSAMFVYTIAKAVNENWIDKRYATVAIKGWEGLKKQMITPDGTLKSVIESSAIFSDLPSYYNISQTSNGLTGVAAVIDAGIEIIKLKRQLGLIK